MYIKTARYQFLFLKRGIFVTTVTTEIVANFVS